MTYTTNPKPNADETDKQLELPFNPCNGKEYFGKLLYILQNEAEQKNYASLEWARFDDWKRLGETIAKDEKGVTGFFYKRQETEEGITYKEIKTILFNRCQLISFKAISSKS